MPICRRGLEQDLQEQQAANAELRGENERVSLEVTELQHKLECTTQELTEASGAPTSACPCGRLPPSHNGMHAPAPAHLQRHPCMGRS